VRAVKVGFIQIGRKASAIILTGSDVSGQLAFGWALV
jgi:hypothetical protein